MSAISSNFPEKSNSFAAFGALICGEQHPPLLTLLLQHPLHNTQ